MRASNSGTWTPETVFLEQRHLDTGDGLHDRVGLHGHLAGERDVLEGVGAEVRTAVEQGVLHRDRGADGEHQLLALAVEFHELGVLLLLAQLLESLVILVLVGILDGEGVVVGTDLHDDVHLAVVVEVDEGVDAGRVPVVDTLEGNLEGTDVLEALDGDFLAAGLFLVEVNRLHDTAVNTVNTADSSQGEEDLDEDFDNLVHYFSVL